MKYRLDAVHYIDDKELPIGFEIGDDTPVPYRHTHDVPDGRGGVFKAGTPIVPSRSMTPLDDEAKKLFRQTFGTDAPERDFSKAIPIQGTGSEAKAPVPGPRPGVDNLYKKPLVDETDQKTSAEAAKPLGSKSDK